MKDKIKIITLFLFKYIGMFKLSKLLTRNKLRILCYHGFNINDEVTWRPGLFLREATFNRRLKYLHDEKYTVLPLDEAIKQLNSNTLPQNAVVITIDDGWYDTFDIAHPLLRKWGFPYTIYLTSYYSMKQTPLFNIVISYMLWKTNKKKVTLDHPLIPMKDTFFLDEDGIREQLSDQIIDYGHANLTNDDRIMVMRFIGEKLDVDYGQIEDERIFHLLNFNEIKNMFLDGVDFQLHAHHHMWPMDEKKAIYEIDENRKFLEPIIDINKLSHFCYPSGIWSKAQLPFLERAGIDSATTCEHGFNSYGDNCLHLKRFLDGEDKRQIEFEAEISGFKTIFKSILPTF